MARFSGLSVWGVLLWLCLGLVTLIMGAAIAFLPPGYLIRLLMLPAGVGFFAICWMLRSHRAGLPGRWVFSLLMLMVALSVLWPRYIFFSIGGPHVNPQTLSVFAGLAAVLFWMIYSPAFSEKVFAVLFRNTRVGLIAVLWLVWRLIAAAFGEVPLLSVFELLRETVYLSSFLLLGAAIASFENGTRALLRVLVLCGFAVASVGLVEAFLQRNPFVQFASGGDSQEVAGTLKTIMMDKFRGGAYRAQSVFDHPIVFAQFISAMIPLGAYFLFYEKGWFWRAVGLLIVPIGILAIVKSGSRAGVVSLAVAFMFLGFVVWLRAFGSRGFGKVWAIVAVPASVFGLVLAYFVVQDLVLGRSQVEASSSSVRLTMLLEGVKALVESPLVGFGQGTALYKAGVISGTTGLATIDNYLLTVALDGGYVSLVLLVALVSVFAWRGGVAAVRRPGADGALIGFLVAAVLAIFATFVGLSIPNNLTLLWLLVAATLSLIARAPTVQARPQ